MLEISATIVLVGLVSAFLPAMPVEPYLLGAVALTGHSVILAGVAAGVGQSAGKALMFLGARGVLRWPLLQRLIQRRKRTGESPDGEAGTDGRAGADGEAGTDGKARADGEAPTVGWLRHQLTRLRAVLRRWGEVLVVTLRRPFLPVPILLLSAVVGFPPLLIVTFYLAGTRMRAWVFTVVCLVGRSARFTVIAAALYMFGMELL